MKKAAAKFLDLEIRGGLFVSRRFGTIGASVLSTKQMSVISFVCDGD